jgi:hypothetical protein
VPKVVKTEDAAHQMVSEVVDIMRAGRSRNAQPLALAFCRVLDAASPVTTEIVTAEIALIELKGLLPDDIRGKCYKALRGGSKNDRRDCCTALMAWAKAYDEKHEIVKPRKEPVPYDAVVYICGMWRERIRYAPGHGKEAPEYARALIVFSEYGDTPRRKASCLGRIEDSVDCSELSDLVHMDGRFISKEHVHEDLPKAIEWVKQNLKYCYFHPEERHLKLDTAARKARVASEEYRKKNPWKENEGPNITDPRKTPVK